MLRRFQVICLPVVLGIVLCSQTVPGQATVSFTLDFPASRPAHYSVQVQSDGKARYDSSSKVSSESDETDSFNYEFMVSASTRDKIFELAARAGYFHKDL